MRAHHLPVVAICLVFLASCAGLHENASAPLDEALGGETTRHDPGKNALSLPAANLASDERRKFEVGDSFFTQNWVTAPSSTLARDGLGPTFNAQACATCHVVDGRGQPPSGPDDHAARGLLYRLSEPGDMPYGGPRGNDAYGGQLQDRAIQGVQPEGEMQISYALQPGRYGDGSSYELRVPTFGVTALSQGPLGDHTMVGPRLAPQVPGMGLLEAIPESDITSRTDPEDKNHDGISGRVNKVWNSRYQRTELGRFGWKANQPTVEQQVADAFLGDIGITSPVDQKQDCPIVQIDCISSVSGGDPEIDDSKFSSVVFYSRVLAVPAMRDVDDPQVKAGARQFVAMGCSTCHTPTMKTGKSDIPELSNQTIHPFTDMLLHDMGPALSDNRPDFQASGSEWRTPPLWMIGLVDDINGHRFLLHDGRARTLEESILWHGGEGEKAKEAFRQASEAQRKALVAYLEAL